ncbi:vinculin isoform 2-T2 [Spinachia spinachia]
MARMPWQRGNTGSIDAEETNTNAAVVAKYGRGNTENDGVESSGSKETHSLTCTALFLKQESDSWDPKDNRIVQMTRKMADTLCYMTQYLKKRGPILNKEAFVTAARHVTTNCQSVTQFIQVIAKHCLDKQCTVELSLIVEQILTITNQLSIISRSSDEILVKNVQNLLLTVLRGVRAAESACITGLKQPEPDSDGAEATALCFQWRRKLEIHRAQQTSNAETDELGLRKTSTHPAPPSLVPQVGFK